MAKRRRPPLRPQKFFGFEVDLQRPTTRWSRPSPRLCPPARILGPLAERVIVCGRQSHRRSSHRSDTPGGPRDPRHRRSEATAADPAPSASDFLGRGRLTGRHKILSRLVLRSSRTSTGSQLQRAGRLSPTRTWHLAPTTPKGQDFRTSTRVSFPSDDDKVRANGKASYRQANSLGAICPSGPVPQAEVDRHMGNPPALGASGGGVEGSEKLVNDKSPKSVSSAVAPRQGPSCSSWTAASPVGHQTAGRGLACPLRRPPSSEVPRRPAVWAARLFEFEERQISLKSALVRFL